jgi:DNA-binding NarL/FixJ family response regulator
MGTIGWCRKNMGQIQEGYMDGNVVVGLRGAAESSNGKLKVLIADDHPLMLLGIRRTLEDYDDIEIVGQAQSGPELLALVERRRPELVLMDLRMPGAQDTSVISHIRETWPEVKIVVLSACDDRPSVEGALLAGASAYIVKSAHAVDVASVLRQTSSGVVYHAPAMARGQVIGHVSDMVEPGESHDGPVLTEREKTILTAIANGLTTKRISSELWVSEHTVKFHLTNIYRKLGVPNRSGAVRYALEHGLAA